MDTNVIDLINFNKVDQLLEGFNKSTGFVTAILDLEGNVLSKSGWRKICIKYHRVNAVTALRCRTSDTMLANKMSEGEKYHFYECHNGLIDVAVPLQINGKHVANLFSGQFFFEAPDFEKFRKQAQEFGFDEEDYLQALREVPVVSQEKVRSAMDFLLDMTMLISDLETQKHVQTRLAEKVSESEERYKSVLSGLLEGCQIIGFDWRYIYINPSAEKQNRIPAEALLGQNYHEMWPGIEETYVYSRIKDCLENGVSSRFENEFVYADGSKAWFDLRIQPVPEGVFILSIDITESRRTQAELKQQRQLLETVINHLPASVSVLSGKDMRIELANPAYRAIAPGKEMIGMTWDELWPETGQNFREICNIVLETGISYHVDDELNTVQRVPGSPPEDAWFSWSLHRIELPGDAGWGLLGTSWETTNRMKAEMMLRESETQYRNLADGGLALIWTAGTDKLRNFFNKTWLQFTGRTLAQELGNGWAEGVHPDDFDACLNVYITAFDKREAFEMVYRLRHVSGEYRYIYDMGTPNYNSKNEFIGYIGYCFDITERKKTEDDLRQSEERFRLVVNNVLDIIVLINADGTQRYVSPASKTITGFETDEHQGLTIVDLVHPDDLPMLYNVWQDILAHPDRTFDAQYRYVHKTMGWVWLEAKGQSFLNVPSINAVLLTARDITAAKEAELALQQSEEKYRLLFNNNPHPMWVYDTHTLQFLAVNEAAVAKYGYSHEEFLTMTLRDIRPEEEVSRLFESVKNAPDGHESSGVWRHRLKNQDIIYVEISSHPIGFEGHAARVVLANDITGRKLAQDKLDYQQQLISDMGHVAKIGGWEFDVVTGKGTWTDETARIHDLDPSLETNVEIGISYYTDESRTAIAQAIQEAVEMAKPYKLQLKMLTAKGVEKWVQTIGLPILENGRVVKVRGSFQDISEQKLAENKLMQSEQRYRALFSHMNAGFSHLEVIEDENGHAVDLMVLAANEGFESATGVRLSDALGRSLKQILPGIENDDADWIGTYCNVALTGRAVQFEQGSELLGAYFAVSAFQPAPKQCAVTFIDITARKKAELALRLSEERYRKMYQNHGAVKLMIDPTNGDIVDANIAAEEFYGWPVEVLKTMTIFQITILTAAKATAILNRVGSTGKGHFEFTHRRADGSLIEVEVFTSLININGKDIIHAIIHDITERKKAEHELISAKEKAEESDRLKTAFLQNLSHEVRTPLNAIIGFSEIISEDDLPANERKRLTGIIVERGWQLTSIINDILTISAIETRQEQVYEAKFDVNQLIQNHLTVYQEHADKKGILLMANSRLSSKEALVYGDKPKIGQVLNNLFNNALKFMKVGFIELGCSLDGDMLLFYVKDTGPGIEHSKHELIFQRFTQADENIRTTFGGTGLGLSICKGFVELMGGKIWIKSTVGIGSVFYFTIPYKPAVEKTVAPPENEPVKETGKKFVVLVAEDENANYELLKSLLLRERVELLHAFNGKEAVDICKSHHIDLVLMDIKMPVLNGYEAAKQIRAIKHGLPIVAQTAHSPQQEIEQYRDAFDDYITKPFTRDVIRRVLHKFLVN